MIRWHWLAAFWVVFAIAAPGPALAQSVRTADAKPKKAEADPENPTAIGGSGGLVISGIEVDVGGNSPIDATYPKLGGQYHDYIEHALKAYRSGDRGGSTTTDLMASQAKELTDQQIADLAAYYGSVTGQLRDLHNAE